MKKIVLSVIIICILAITLTGCSDNIIEPNNENVTDMKETINELAEIYKDDELINKFLNKYNELYVDEPITSEMLTVYYHHGSYHKDQVQFTIQGMEITLTGGSFTNKVSVFIEKENNTDDSALRNLIKRFVKVYNNEITDAQIEEHLNNQGDGSDIETYENIEYWTNKGYGNNTILNIKLTGEID